MEPTCSTELSTDPCLQIQMDLSAMLDGELDAPSVRRVMVHSDVCAACGDFLSGIRSQAQLHRELAGTGVLDASSAERATSPRAARLRQQLTENRRRLAQILYEMGRGFVLMGLSPDFSREVAREPVPVPDMAQRGRSLLDEVARLGAGSSSADGGAVKESSQSWVAAEELLDGRIATPAENLGKGQRLLNECLLLAPGMHEARIYLGLLHHVRGQRSFARRQFGIVLAEATEVTMRSYALLSLGTLHLDEGDHDGAIALLQQVVESGVIASQPRLGMAYFNLGLAHGMKQEFAPSLHWFQRLHDELPHRELAVHRELQRRPQFLALLGRDAKAAQQFAAALPAWFAGVGELAGPGLDC